MIGKEAIELLKKYSFLKDVKRKGVYIYFEYEKDGKVLSKRLPLRGTGPQVQKIITDIRIELGIGKYGKGRNADYYII